MKKIAPQRPIGSAPARWVSAIALFMFLLPAGCNDDKPPKKEPTQPWRKDETASGQAEHRQSRRYILAPGQTLHFALPGREAKPTGTLTGISGEVNVALRELSLTRGSLRLDLTQLTLDEPVAPRQTAPEKDADLPVTAAQATRTALEWLGLGSKVSPSDKSKNRHAVFEFESLRDLSHHSAHTGALRKGSEKGQVRQVYATAEGELSLRGLSVTRQIALLIRFLYTDKAGPESLPSNIEVSLRPNVHVPLSEYEIMPRSEAGMLLSHKMDLIGSTVGSVAHVQGTIAFVPASER